MGKPEGKRQLGRHPRRWEDNTKMGTYDGSFRTGFVRLGLGKVSGCCDKVMSRWVVQNARNFFASLEAISFSRRILLHGISHNLLPKNVRSFVAVRPT